MNSQFNRYGKKVNGKIEFHDEIAFNHWVANLEEGSDIVAKYNDSKHYKTNRQVRLAYLCFRKIAAHTGYSVSEVKIRAKYHQGLCFSHIIEGREIADCKSISDMTKKEISEFIINMDLWCTQELGLHLLENDDIQFLKS